MKIEINKQYLAGAALGGFFGFFVSSQLVFFHHSQALWLMMFGGVGGYAIAESVDLKKQRDSDWQDSSHLKEFKEETQKCREMSSEMLVTVRELQSCLTEFKTEKSNNI